MAQRRYIKKKKVQKDFPYKPIKNHLTWYDAQSETGWISLEDIEKLKPAISKTKGWIYKETDEYIITFGTYSKDANDNIIEFGEVLCVPKNWI
jgi:hypothetical protein|tara:strand:+ start:25 stop:303 length:279 start_codon:yes stop_codon:yes gene_type:complete